MIGHSIAKIQQTTKLEHIGVRARTEKDTVFNNLGHVIDLDLLRISYHQLDARKAVGCDGVTKGEYGIRLEENLRDLLVRLRKGTYRPQPSRLVEIPKEDGNTRPLAIGCLEDKIVQQAVKSILTQVFEPLFLDSSYGYREGVNGHEALRALMKCNDQNINGATVEIDLRKYFNTIPHKELMEMLAKKITDRRFLALVLKLIRMPIMENGKPVLNRIGCPQGSIISPILSNIYLDHVIDAWFDNIRHSHFKGRAEEVRFADDMVFVFQHMEDAERFYRVLPKRLDKFGLSLHAQKSSMISSGRRAAAIAAAKGERIPTYKFLGFTCYWGKSRNGQWRLKYKSRADRLSAKLKGLRKYLKENLNSDTDTILTRVKQVMVGWINYHAISDNARRVEAFIAICRRTLFWWINRKGGKRRMSWVSFDNVLKQKAFPAQFKTTTMFASKWS